MEISKRSASVNRSEDTSDSFSKEAEQGILVKAKISHHWRGDYYSQDSPIVASERAVKENVKAGLWYYDSGDSEWDSTLTTEAENEDCGC